MNINNINAEDEHGNTALIHSVMWGEVKGVIALIEAGADVNAVNKYGNTALIHAVRWGDVEAVKALLKEIYG